MPWRVHLKQIRLSGSSFKRLLMTMAERRQPLIVVLGATGSGKSKLAVELAAKFNGEVINADAVQMYKGLPIVTNKIPVDERKGIKHHSLDQIELHEQPWTVLEFVQHSSAIIEQIRARGKLPVVVGGTNYYIYSLLFREATVGASKVDETLDTAGDGPSDRLAILDEPNEIIYAKLMEVDPVMAKRWHPNDRRRVQRSLEIWLTTGMRASEIYAEQKAAKEVENDGIEALLRHDPLIFWIDAEKEVLKQRLNNRVDGMVAQGLLDEVKMMREFEMKTKQQGSNLDKSKGIWVAIGYKEMGRWLDLCESNSNSTQLDEAREQGIEAIKAGTRQYAKRQNNWIRIKVAQSLQKAGRLDRLLLLDGSSIADWNLNVADPSQSAMTAFLADDLASPALHNLAEKAYEQVQKDLTRPAQQTNHCDTCQQTTMTADEWTKHLKSSGHKRALQGAQKRAKREEYFAKMAAEAAEKSACSSSAHGISVADIPNTTT